jgi:hypothetical protein
MYSVLSSPQNIAVSHSFRLFFFSFLEMTANTPEKLIYTHAQPLVDELISYGTQVTFYFNWSF